MEKPFVLCLMGPTASGKTALAIELVQQYPCDIVSVDSAMVYRDMDIGTAKPDADTLAIAPHRLIDIRDPREPYSAAEFVADATNEINAIHKTGRIPLLTGGTMLYFRSLQLGLSDMPSANKSVRAKITHEAAEKGWQALHDKLRDIDPLSAERIHPNDPQRLQRALEVFHVTGKSLSEWWAQDNKALSPFHFINIAIVPEDRSMLHERIHARFDAMLLDGFVEEVRTLKTRADMHLDLPSMRSVGYRQVWQHLEGELGYDEMRERAIIATRQLAKRQLTWLRSWQGLHTQIEPNLEALKPLLGTVL